MSLDAHRKDRSYQYGRLLAVMERAERVTYGFDEKRETNAIRLQSAFVRRPMQTAAIIIEQLKKAYYPQLKPGSRRFYEGLIGEVQEEVSAFPDGEWNAPLQETYLMGYYLQKRELERKKGNEQEKEEEDEA